MKIGERCFYLLVEILVLDLKFANITYTNRCTKMIIMFYNASETAIQNLAIIVLVSLNKNFYLFLLLKMDALIFDNIII